MKCAKILFLLGLLTTLAACSTQTRYAAEMATEEDLFGEEGVFYEITGQMNDGVFSTMSTDTMASGTSTFLFHARETKGRPALSIFNAKDLSLISSEYGQGQGTHEIGMQEIDVLFIDHVNESGRQFALGFRIVDADGTLYATGLSDYDSESFSDNDFQVRMYMDNGQDIVVRIEDLSPDYSNELGDAVKLKLYTESNGRLTQFGQVSSMHGYGNRQR